MWAIQCHTGNTFILLYSCYHISRSRAHRITREYAAETAIQCSVRKALCPLSSKKMIEVETIINQSVIIIIITVKVSLRALHA
jgi:hypothetical protein